jgi:hypothetical protein
MSIQGFNIEEDNEEIRDEIEEGVNMYEEDKAIPAYDIKLTLDDVSGMTPGIITEKQGLKIVGDIIEETAIRLIKNIADQVFIVDTLNDDQVNQIIEEAMINAPFEDVIEDATIIEDIIKEDVVTEEPLVEEVLEEEVIEPTTDVNNDINLTSNEAIDLNQGTVNMDLDSMFSDDEEIIDEDLISEDDILEVTEDGSGYINPATGEVESFDNLGEVSLEDVIFPDVPEIDGSRIVDTLTEDEINQIEAQVINEARKEEIKEAPVRDATYIKETNYPVEDTFLEKEDYKFSSSLDAINNIIKEIDVDNVVTKLDVDSKGNYLVLELYVDEILLLEMLLSSHGEVMVTSDNIATIEGAIAPRIVNFDTRFRNAINCKWNHNYDTYAIKAEDEAGKLVDQTVIVSKDNADMQEHFYKPIAATIEGAIPHALDNGHIASQSLTQVEYDDLEDKVVVIDHLNPITKEIEPFTYAIKKVVTPIQGMNARNVQLAFQRLQLIGDAYYVAGVYYSQAFIETVKEVTI